MLTSLIGTSASKVMIQVLIFLVRVVDFIIMENIKTEDGYCEDVRVKHSFSSDLDHTQVRIEHY